MEIIQFQLCLHENMFNSLGKKKKPKYCHYCVITSFLIFLFRSANFASNYFVSCSYIKQKFKAKFFLKKKRQDSQEYCIKDCVDFKHFHPYFFSSISRIFIVIPHQKFLWSLLCGFRSVCAFFSQCMLLQYVQLLHSVFLEAC